MRICPDKLGYQCHPSEWGDIDNFSGTKKIEAGMLQNSNKQHWIAKKPLVITMYLPSLEVTAVDHK